MALKAKARNDVFASPPTKRARLLKNQSADVPAPLVLVREDVSVHLEIADNETVTDEAAAAASLPASHLASTPRTQTSRLLSLPQELRDKIWCILIPDAQLREVGKYTADQVRTANAEWMEAKKIAVQLQGLHEASKSSGPAKEDQALRQRLHNRSSELNAKMRFYNNHLRVGFPGRFYNDSCLPIIRDFEPVAITDPAIFSTCRQMRMEARRCMFEQNVIAIKFETKGPRAQRRNMQLTRSVLESSLDGLSHARNIVVTVRAIDVWSLKTALEGRGNIHKLHVLLKTSIGRPDSSYVDQAVSRLQPLGAIPVREEAIVEFARDWFDDLSDDSDLRQALKAIEDEMLRSWADLSKA